MIPYIMSSLTSVCAYMAFPEGTAFYNLLNRNIKSDEDYEFINTLFNGKLHGGCTYISLEGENRPLNQFSMWCAKDRNTAKYYLSNSIIIGWDYLHSMDVTLDLIDIIKDINNIFIYINTRERILNYGL